MYSRIFFLSLFFLFPTVALAAGHTYTCATEWSGSALQNSATCSSDTIHFTTANTQSAANNGAGNTLYNLTNAGAGQTVYLTATLANDTGTVTYGCYGDTTNCSFGNLSSGANNEVSMTVPSQSSFAYLVFTNSSGGASGDISSICIDLDGTSCTAGGGGGGATTTQSTSTPESVNALSQLGFNAIVLFFISMTSTIWTWHTFMR